MTIIKKIKLLTTYPVPFHRRLLVLLDYFSLHKNTGISLREYYNFEFERQTAQFRESFLCYSEECCYLKVLNPLKYFILACNKYVAHKIMENTGISTPDLICYYNPDITTSRSGEIAGDLDSVLQILYEKKVKECVVKDAEGAHGANVFVISAIDYAGMDTVAVLNDGQEIRFTSMFCRKPMVIESRVHQTVQFSRFNSTSVNTIRIMTTMYPDGNVKIIAAFLKIGRWGRCVDNAGLGGNIDAAVDIDSGRLYNTIIFNGWRDYSFIDCHPDNGTKINDVVVENWKEIKKKVIQYQKAFPYCRASGWDIAVTENGPVVLEVNDRWDVTGQLFIGKGWKAAIQDCYRAWKVSGRDKEISDYRFSKFLSKRQVTRINSKILSN